MNPFFVDPDIRKARTLDKEFYLSAHCFEEAKEKVFKRCWHFAADKNIFQRGNCFPFDLLPGYLNEPLLLTRDQQRQIRCLPNVCTHRGNLLVYEACQRKQLRCKYHGRLFELNGKMISMPEFEEVLDFPSGEDHLRQLPVFDWGNLLFISLDASISSARFFGPVQERLSWLPLHEFEYKQQYSKDYVVDANWALYCENYLEGFHIPFVHAGLNAAIDYGAYTTELFELSSLQLGIARKNEPCFALPASSSDSGKNIYAYYFWIFPNLMLNFYPWGLSMNVVQPLAADKTRVSFLTFVWKDELFDPGSMHSLDKVEMEDEEVVQQVQRGIRSGFYQHGRYSATREQGTHHFHRLIAEFMNSSIITSSSE